MNLKRIAIIDIIFIFLFSFITHNIYNWFPSTLTSIFFPVNESIWEHQKMIFITVLIWGLVEYFLLKNKCANNSNLITITVATAIANILIFLILYIPVNEIFEESRTAELIVYLVSIIITQYIGYKLFSVNIPPQLNLISILVIPLIIIIFGLLTYKPPHIDDLFYDEVNHKYGIYSYYEIDLDDENEIDDD